MASVQALAQQSIISAEDGWRVIESKGITKLRDVIAGESKGFSNQEYADLYTLIYKMCIQKGPACCARQLYDKYYSSISEYLMQVTLTAIQAKSGDFLVKEFVQRWEDHKIMKKWMCDFFKYLDRFYVKRHSRDPLPEVR